MSNDGRVRWLDLIASGIKMYEGRTAEKIDTWDLFVGKDMVFYDDRGLEVTVEIVSLPVFKSFGDAYDALGDELVPVESIDRKSVEELYREYNTDTDVNKYGVVAIGVKVLDVDR